MKTKAPYVPGGVREMLSIALPMIVSYACDTVMMFSDRLLLSKLGPDLMNAAVGGGFAAFLMVSFGFGLIGYSSALVAQYLGSGSKASCPRVTAQAWILAFFIFPVILAFRPHIHGLFESLHVPAGQLEAQIIFFDILTFGSILVLVRQSFCSFFSGIGKTRIVMLSSLLAMTVNIAVSYVLIYGKWGMPALGISGAACGNLAGTLSAVITLAAAYFGKKNCEEFSVWGSLRFDFSVMKKLLRYGFPSGIEFFLSLVAANGLVLAFHSMGPVVATASSIVLNWDMAAYIPLMGMEVAVTSLVGRYMGARTIELAHRSTMSGLKVGFAYAGLLLVLFGFFPGVLASVFHPSGQSMTFDAAQPLAVDMLRLISFYVLSIVIVIVFVGALRGAGDTVWAMSYHISLHWISVGVLYGSTRFFGFNALHAWGLLICVFLALSSIAWLRYRSGSWKKIQVLAS